MLVHFHAFFIISKGNNFMPLPTFRKGSTLKSKEIVPMGAKSLS